MITDNEVLALIYVGTCAISGKNHINYKTRKARTKCYLKYFSGKFFTYSELITLAPSQK